MFLTIAADAVLDLGDWQTIYDVALGELRAAVPVALPVIAVMIGIPLAVHVVMRLVGVEADWAGEETDAMADAGVTPYERALVHAHNSGDLDDEYEQEDAEEAEDDLEELEAEEDDRA